MGRNDPCPCGSGRKYKKCCLGKRELSQYSLRYRNLQILAAAFDIFGLDKRNWDDVKKIISPDRVKAFYQMVADIWSPKHTDMDTIFESNHTKLKAIYMGDIQPELLARSIFRFSLYTDEILVVNPFHNPWVLAPEYNPIEHPYQWLSDTLKVLYFLREMAPWISAGIVTLIPDPGDFKRSLRFQTWKLAEERLKNRPIDMNEMGIYKDIFYKEHLRVWLTAPNEVLIEKIREGNPNISEEEIAVLRNTLDDFRKNDPLFLGQKEFSSGIVVGRAGVNLEMGLVLCHLAGAFPYTSMPLRWKELLDASDELPDIAKIWTPLSKSFAGLEFSFLDRVNSQFACNLRQDGRLESFRAFLRRLWNSISGDIPTNTKAIEDNVLAFKDELAYEYQKAQAEWKQIDRELSRSITYSALAALTGTGAFIATGHLLFNFPLLGFALKTSYDLVERNFKRSEYRKRVPMSVFIDLKK